MKQENILGLHYPELSKEWHPAKNNDETPMDITYGSSRKVWWLCEKNHAWQASPYKRAKSKNGCPYCAGRLIATNNTLSFTHPKISMQWHPTKNTITPDEVMKGSHKSVWWLCEKGHEWEARIYSRQKNGCPFCSGNQVSPDNCLEIVNPELSREWHPTKNGEETPKEVTSGSKKVIWWQCKEKHEWKTTVSSRKTSGCPYCSGLKIDRNESFGITNAELLKQWDFSKNKISPYECSNISSATVLWTCENNHSYKSMIKTKVKGGKCPYCSGKKKNIVNQLDIVSPELSKEWHPTKNGDLKPSDVTYGTIQKAWWLCAKGHEWKSSISDRHKGTGCSFCFKSTQTSFPEQLLYFYLSKHFAKVESRYGHVIGEKNVETDIYIPDLNIAIEYDGSYFHKNKKVSDKQKNQILNKHGIRLIRIREEGLPPLSEHHTINILNIKSDTTSREKMVLELFELLISEFNLSIDIDSIQIDIERDRVEIMNNYKDIFEKMNLTVTHPEIAKEWNFEKNLTLMPDNFTSGSGQTVWWKCQKGHEWKTSIYSRKKTGCPHCSGRIVDINSKLPYTHPHLLEEWDYEKNGDLRPENYSKGTVKRVWWKCAKNHSFDSRISNRALLNRGCPYCANKKACLDNCLVTINPKVAKEWHPTKNGKLTPNEVVFGSNKKAWWLCTKGHEWEASITSRTRLGSGCRSCYEEDRRQNFL